MINIYIFFETWVTIKQRTRMHETLGSLRSASSITSDTFDTNHSEQIGSGHFERLFYMILWNKNENYKKIKCIIFFRIIIAISYPTKESCNCDFSIFKRHTPRPGPRAVPSQNIFKMAASLVTGACLRLHGRFLLWTWLGKLHCSKNDETSTDLTKLLNWT